MNTSDQAVIAAAADTYKIPLPADVTQAQELHRAASAYRLEVAALIEPNLYAIATASDIVPTIDAVLAFSQREQRLALASRVEANAASDLTAAFSRFASVLMTELATPFDKAAAAFMAAHDRGEPQKPATLATLSDLVRVRDTLAADVGSGLPPGQDRPTRVATYDNREDVMNRFRSRTFSLGRGSREWFEAILSIEGARLKWMTPEAQRVHVAAVPAGREGARVIA